MLWTRAKMPIIIVRIAVASLVHINRSCEKYDFFTSDIERFSQIVQSRSILIVVVYYDVVIKFVIICQFTWFLICLCFT